MFTWEHTLCWAYVTYIVVLSTKTDVAVVGFILKDSLSSGIVRANGCRCDAARLCESPAVALSSHRQRRAESRRSRRPMAWKRGSITVLHSGFIVPHKTRGATRRRRERARTLMRMRTQHLWRGYRCRLLVAVAEPGQKKEVPGAAATPASELGFSAPVGGVSLSAVGSLHVPLAVFRGISS